MPNDPTVTDPDATGTGFANYGFNGQPGGAGAPATGHFNYVNHVVAGNLHVNGPVTDVDVVALNPDGTPQTARLSGTCDGFLPSCTFSVLTEDNGEPAVDDRFGVTIVSAGQVVEARSLRRGPQRQHPVPFGHADHHRQRRRRSASARRCGCAPGCAATRPAHRPTPTSCCGCRRPVAVVDRRRPGGRMVPLARNFVPMDLDAEILALQIPPGTPPGVYNWLSALTQAGTLDLLTGIAERAVTVTP